jgi:hypothetical protein
MILNQAQHATREVYLCHWCLSNSILAPLTLVRAAPATGDEHRIILEHLPQYRNLGQLELSRRSHGG